MTSEDKELLLKDLCARLPYGVKILHEGWNFEWDQELSLLERVIGINDEFIYTKIIDTHTGDEYRDDKHPISTFDDKPYLRPMSSMTEEEKKEYHELCDSYYGIYFDSINSIDWLNKNMFDYRGLIPMGLAIEVTKEDRVGGYE